MVAAGAWAYMRADSRMTSALTQHFSSAASGVHWSARSFKPSQTVFTGTSWPSTVFTMPRYSMSSSMSLLWISTMDCVFLSHTSMACGLPPSRSNASFNGTSAPSMMSIGALVCFCVNARS